MNALQRKFLCIGGGHVIIDDLLLISLLHIIYNIVAFCQSVIYLTATTPRPVQKGGVLCEYTFIICHLCYG